MQTAIWWIRRDLRLTDQTALTAALQEAGDVVPLFVIDPALTEAKNASPKRQVFLQQALQSLDGELRQRGSRLILRRGSPAEVLAQVAAESGAAAIYAEADYSPYARRRDAAVAHSLPLKLVGGPSLHHPEAVVKADGTPYTVYTPYMRAWKSQPLPRPDSILPAPSRIPFPALELVSEIGELNLPTDAAQIFPANEAEAQHRLMAFAEGATPRVFQYVDLRNRLDLNGTSQLSPYLRFGMISARQAVVAVQVAEVRATEGLARKSAETWLNELIWREFYMTILYHFPDVLQQSFRADLRQIPWRNDVQEFAAWCEGRTGYPIVDAGMRQLAHTGWMHNRARMIVASFLVKDLLVDWRWGEGFFMEHLLDGDPAANNGGWQWTAGTGTDAAPYFRIFNPVLQGEKFDPAGEYIRQWVPELTNVPDERIHKPWEMTELLQAEVGVKIGRDYPQPVVDHGMARRRTLDVYQMEKMVAVQNRRGRRG